MPSWHSTWNQPVWVSQKFKPTREMKLILLGASLQSAGEKTRLQLGWPALPCWDYDVEARSIYFWTSHFGSLNREPYDWLLSGPMISFGRGYCPRKGIPFPSKHPPETKLGLFFFDEITYHRDHRTKHLEDGITWVLPGMYLHLLGPPVLPIQPRSFWWFFTACCGETLRGMHSTCGSMMIVLCTYSASPSHR